MSSFEVLTIVGTLIFLEGILSLDNAAILGAIASKLPADQAVPWPRGLRAIGSKLNRLLGNQRQAALKVGLFGAYAGRLLMLFLASWIVHNPWLKLAGGGYLLKLGLEGISIAPKEKQKEQQIHAPESFWSAVAVIELVDLAFSLDNVLAAVAISEAFWVIALGVGLGIIAMRFAASIFAYLIKIEPHLVRAAYLLIFVIAIELILEQLAQLHVEHWQRLVISLAIIGFTFLYRRLPPYLQLQRTFRLIGTAGYYLDEGINYLFVPVKLSLRFAFVEVLRPTGLRLAHVYSRIEKIVIASVAYIAIRLRRIRGSA